MKFSVGGINIFLYCQPSFLHQILFGICSKGCREFLEWFPKWRVTNLLVILRFDLVRNRPQYDLRWYPVCLDPALHEFYDLFYFSGKRFQASQVILIVLYCLIGHIIRQVCEPDLDAAHLVHGHQMC